MRRRQVPLPKVKSASGPGGTGSPTRTLVDPPVRHHGSGATNAVRGVLANTHRVAGSPSPPESGWGFERGSSQRPRSPGSANQCAARCSGCRSARPPSTPTSVEHDGRVGASRDARKHVSFRRLQKLDSGRHGAAAVGEQSPTAAVRRHRSTARSAASPRGGESRARSGHCQPARRTTGRRAFLDASNRGGFRSKWCGDELDPTGPSKSPGSCSRWFAPQRADSGEPCTRCRKAALNEQGTRGARQKVLNRPPLERLGLDGWSCTSSPRRLSRRAPLSGVSVPEARFEPFASVPALCRGGQRL